MTVYNDWNEVWDRLKTCAAFAFRKMQEKTETPLGSSKQADTRGNNKRGRADAVMQHEQHDNDEEDGAAFDSDVLISTVQSLLHQVFAFAIPHVFCVLLMFDVPVHSVYECELFGILYPPQVSEDVKVNKKVSTVVTKISGAIELGFKTVSRQQVDTAAASTSAGKQASKETKDALVLSTGKAKQASEAILQKCGDNKVISESAVIKLGEVQQSLADIKTLLQSSQTAPASGSASGSRDVASDERSPSYDCPFWTQILDCVVGSMAGKQPPNR